MRYRLLSVGSDAKTKKGEKLNVKTAVLYLAPYTEASERYGRKVNLCPHASAGCAASCLFTAGRGGMEYVYDARVKRTLSFLQDPRRFLADLKADIARFSDWCQKRGYVCAARLNGTSDRPWEKLIDMTEFPDVRFYDYTKNPQRAIANARGKHPVNYHLTFSRSECNESAMRAVLQAGGNVAVVFKNGMPAKWRRRPVINGDESDVRFYDRKGVIVGLKAKGSARRDESGFAVDAAKLKGRKLEV